MSNNILKFLHQIFRNINFIAPALRSRDAKVLFVCSKMLIIIIVSSIFMFKMFQLQANAWKFCALVSLVFEMKKKSNNDKNNNNHNKWQSTLLCAIDRIKVQLRHRRTIICCHCDWFSTVTSFSSSSSWIQSLCHEKK